MGQCMCVLHMEQLLEGEWCLILKMETISSSETLRKISTIRRRNPKEACQIVSSHRENLKTSLKFITQRDKSISIIGAINAV